MTPLYRALHSILIELNNDNDHDTVVEEVVNLMDLEYAQNGEWNLEKEEWTKRIRLLERALYDLANCVGGNRVGGVPESEVIESIQNAWEVLGRADREPIQTSGPHRRFKMCADDCEGSCGNSSHPSCYHTEQDPILRQGSCQYPWRCSGTGPRHQSNG